MNEQELADACVKLGTNLVVMRELSPLVLSEKIDELIDTLRVYQEILIALVDFENLGEEELADDNKE